MLLAMLLAILIGVDGFNTGIGTCQSKSKSDCFIHSFVTKEIYYRPISPILTKHQTNNQ